MLSLPRADAKSISSIIGEDQGYVPFAIVPSLGVGFFEEFTFDAEDMSREDGPSVKDDINKLTIEGLEPPTIGESVLCVHAMLLSQGHSENNHGKYKEESYRDALRMINDTGFDSGDGRLIRMRYWRVGDAYYGSMSSGDNAYVPASCHISCELYDGRISMVFKGLGISGYSYSQLDGKHVHYKVNLSPRFYR